MTPFEVIVVCVVALGASALTLFSGFGLGTLLLPAFALVFPVEVAVVATAVVHLLNNLFKLALVGRHASLRIVAAFGVPALFAAIVGAWLLGRLAGMPPLARYSLGGREYEVKPVTLVVAGLIFFFALWDLLPLTSRVRFPSRFIPVGGALSGLFGGLSGHQGALRSAFLIHAGLGKEGFVGTGVACAVLVDLARLGVYGNSIVRRTTLDGSDWVLVGVASACAFTGAWLGVRLLGKMRLETLHAIVAVGLCLLAVGMGAGLV